MEIGYRKEIRSATHRVSTALRANESRLNDQKHGY